MRPDLIPDAAFYGKRPDIKRDRIIEDFLSNPIKSDIYEARIIILNKSKDPTPEVTSLRPISITNTVQKLLEISIFHHLKDYIKLASPSQYGFKPNTGTGKATLELYNELNILKN